MRVFRLLGLRRLRHQPLRGVLAVVSVAGGVSLAVAILVTTASIDGSVRDFGRTLAGPAELRIVGATDRGGLSLGSVAAAEQVDGVTAVVPVVQAVALVDRLDPGIGGSDAANGVEASTALVLGVDCRAVALLGAVPCDDALLAAAGDRPLAMSTGVVAAAGDAPSLRTEAGRVDLTGVPTVESLGGFGGGATVVFSLQAAQARFGRVGVDVAYVVLEEAADLGEVRRRIEAVLPPQDAVLGRDDPPPVVEVGLAGFLPLFNMLGLFGLATAVILVRNTVTLSLAERRRSLAVVGALGAAPRTLVGGVVGEAALLGGIGGAMGVGLGVVLAGPIVASLSGFTESVVGIPLDRQVPGSIAVVGLLLGASAGAVAAWRPARRSVRLDVAAELSGRAVVDDARPPRLVRGLALALGLLGVGVGLCWLSQRNGGLEPWQLSVGPLGFLLAAVATFLSGTAAPLLLRKAAHLTRGTRRAPLRLAFANIVREPRRAGIMAVAIASPVVVGFTTDGFVASARAAITESFERNDDFVSISTVDPGDGSVGFLSPEMFSAAEALPEVERVQRGAFVLAGNTVADIVGVTAVDATEFDDGEPGLLRGAWEPERFAAGEVLIGPGLARSTGARDGDLVTVATPAGPRQLTVLGVVANGNFGGRNIQTTYEQLESLFGPPPVGFANLVPAAGSTAAEVLIAAEAALGPLDPALRVRSSDEILDEIGASVDSQMAPFRIMQQGLVFVSFVAVLSTLLLVGMQRQRETGLLAAVGAAPPDLRRTVLTEALLVGAAAVIQAVVLGLVMLWALTQIVPVIIGFRNPYQVAWGTSLGAAATALVVTALAAAWPAWRASNVEVLEALRYE